MIELLHVHAHNIQNVLYGSIEILSIFLPTHTVYRINPDKILTTYHIRQP